MEQPNPHLQLSSRDLEKSLLTTRGDTDATQSLELYNFSPLAENGVTATLTEAGLRTPQDKLYL